MKSSEAFFAKYKDPRWKKRRDEIVVRDGHKCQECGSTVGLQVHHRYYRKNRDPWDYPDFCLVTLCDGCHELVKNPDVHSKGYFTPEPWEIQAHFFVGGNRAETARTDRLIMALSSFESEQGVPNGESLDMISDCLLWGATAVKRLHGQIQQHQKNGTLKETFENPL